MEPIRILHVIENFSLNNGVNSVVMNYYNHIDRSRFIFDSLCTSRYLRKISEDLGKMVPGFI